MLTQEEIEHTYDGMAKEIAGLMGRPLDASQAAFSIESAIICSTLGIVLGKTEQEIGDDIMAHAEFIHRENPSILALIKEGSA